MSILEKLIKLIEKLKKPEYININYNYREDYMSEIPYKKI